MMKENMDDSFDLLKKDKISVIPTINIQFTKI